MTKKKGKTFWRTVKAPPGTVYKCMEKGLTGETVRVHFLRKEELNYL